MKDELYTIIRRLIDGVNPITGELFDKSILEEDSQLSKAIIVLALSTQKNLHLKKALSTNSLNRDSKKIFEQLKSWRLDTCSEIGLPAYCVFSDEDLWSIAEGDVVSKEDLLFVKGIGQEKYERYGDDLFDIICDPLSNGK